MYTKKEKKPSVVNPPGTGRSRKNGRALRGGMTYKEARDAYYRGVR